MKVKVKVAIKKKNIKLLENTLKKVVVLIVASVCTVKYHFFLEQM